MLNTYTVPCLFFYSLEKPHCYLSVSTLTSKNITASLFVVSLSLNMFFLTVFCFSTCEYINHTYPVAVYTLNTGRTPYCLFSTAKNVPFNFHAVGWPSKHKPDLCSNLETSKYIRRYLFCCLFASKYVIFAF